MNDWSDAVLKYRPQSASCCSRPIDDNQPIWSLKRRIFACILACSAMLTSTVLTTSANAQIEIAGVPRDVRSTIEQYTQNLPGADCLSSAQIPSELHSNVSQSIQVALDAHGYYFPEVTLVTKPVGDRDATPDCHALVANVNLGSKPIIRSQSFQSTGHSTAEVNELLSKPFDSEALFDPQLYERYKRMAMAQFRDNGFLDAQWETTEVKIHDDNTAHINWSVATGPRYRISKIRTNQSTLTPELFEHYLSLTEDEPLLASFVTETHNRLRDSGYFKKVEVTPLLSERENETIPVEITVEPVAARSLLIGGGFATDTGPRLRGVVDFHRLNKHGHRANISTLVSPAKGDLSAEYRWPYGNPQHEWYGVTMAGGYEDTDSTESELINFGINRTQRLGKHWTLTTFSSLQFEDYSVGTVDDSSRLLFFGANFGFTTAINTARPRTGRSISIEAKTASSALFSDQDVVRLSARAKQIVPLPLDMRLILRANLGHSWQDDFEELPATLRFFAGGDQSIRGFGLEEVGDQDELGNVIGGDKLITGSLELDVPVYKQWSAALFFDTGAAFSDTPDFARSIGVGARWYSPLGPIRIDLAHPLNQSSQSIRLHVSIGADL